MNKPVYDLREYEPYAACEQEYLHLIRQRNEMVNKYKEEAAKLRRKADEAYTAAVLHNAAAAMGQANEKKARSASEEYEAAVKLAQEAEEKARQKEKEAEWIDKAIALKNEELKARAKEARRYLLPRVKADHAPAVAKVAQLLRELAEAVREEREIARAAESVLTSAEGGIAMLLPPLPFADDLLEIDRQGRYWGWMQDAKQYLEENRQYLQKPGFFGKK